MSKYKPVVLMILDGLGISPDRVGSPWEGGDYPTFSEIEKYYPFTTLQASGIAVGLPWGEAGNSEVGHLTIGAGRVIYNYLPRISTAIADGSFFKNESFLKAIEHVQKNNSSLHIAGVFSTGTVHAYFEHIYALLDLAQQNNIKRVYLHLFTDGKDAKKDEGFEFFKKTEENIRQKYPEAKIASVVGRKYPMNRSGDWDLTEKAYKLFTEGAERQFVSVSDYIKTQYNEGNFDVSVEPAILDGGEGRIKDGDALIFSNFREDSMRQITEAFASEKFIHFDRKKITDLLIVTMTRYDERFDCLAAFESAKVEFPLAKVVSDGNLSQIHIAETEKYAHVTYFLNGGQEIPFKKEDRMLIPSPDVSSYDQKPEMSAKSITEAVAQNLGSYDFIVVNYANADMVGHTGNLEATTLAMKTLDKYIGELMPKILDLGGALVITADHGNAEEKIYKLTGEKKTKHSINPIPFYLIAKDYKTDKPLEREKINKKYKDVGGTLTNTAPTVLELLGLSKPLSMEGESLLKIFQKPKQEAQKQKISFWKRIFGK